jgi:hypothetical protein
MSAPITTKFCTACANPLIATAVICPKCGSPVNAVPPIVGGKSKTTAVLLAVFFGTWAWLYTYRLNASKFWVTTIVLFGVPFLVFILNFITYSSGNYRGVQGWMVALPGLIWFPSLFAFWLWSIIDNAVKTDNWYRNYWNN